MARKRQYDCALCNAVSRAQNSGRLRQFLIIIRANLTQRKCLCNKGLRAGIAFESIAPTRAHGLFQNSSDELVTSYCFSDDSIAKSSGQ